MYSVHVRVHVHVIVTVKTERRFTLNLGKTATQRPRVRVHARRHPVDSVTAQYSALLKAKPGRTRPYEVDLTRVFCGEKLHKRTSVLDH